MGMIEWITRERVSPVRVFLVVISWAVALASVVSLIVVVRELIIINLGDWGLFFATRIPSAWFNLSMLFVGTSLLEYMIPGQTITSLACVNTSSPPEDKRTACYFVIGYAALIVWCCR
jgi:hypothetical protein